MIVHPATWFKIEFPDKKFATVRPSAMKPYLPDGSSAAVVPLVHANNNHSTENKQG
jgi:hypothetical protein